MKIQFIGLMLVFVSFSLLISCRTTNAFSSPISTLKKLQKSINKKNWELASLCFTEEIRTKNEESMNKKEFYFMETGTVQSLLVPIPILSENAKFKIKEIDAEKAIVEIYYPNFVDKDGRLKQLTLTKSNRDEWKVDKILWKRE